MFGPGSRETSEKIVNECHKALSLHKLLQFLISAHTCITILLDDPSNRYLSAQSFVSHYLSLPFYSVFLQAKSISSDVIL